MKSLANILIKPKKKRKNIHSKNASKAQNAYKKVYRGQGKWLEMEEKIDKLIQGQVEIQTKLNTMDEKTKDQEKRIRSLENKFWTALGTFAVGIGTFIEGIFLGK